MANYADKRGTSFPGVAGASASLGDPYGKNSTGATGSSASFRQRGDASQKRVNNDTRVRDDANSGTAGANGTSAATTMASALDAQQGSAPLPDANAPVMTASWQATRQPVDIDTVRQRVLQSLKQ